ncbi:MAG TPA: signal peptidase I [Burkholderiaceae bacterium]|nr:signal peptidase I [Burkholderiaceae bacterium]
MNFALILFSLLVVTGVAWIVDKLWLAPARRRAGRDRQPLWLEYTAGLFPVILVVFVLRSFLVEPFKIPSGSMIPTLLVGDLILVNKYAYGVRLPVVHTKVLDVGLPERGDVMVFRFPKDASVDYIKRVVGLPGDTVTYENNRLTINGQPVPMQAAGEFYDPDRLVYYRQYSEKLGDVEHKLLTELDKPSFISGVEPFPFRDGCTYGRTGLTCKVPAGHYFVMGDNRENSLDSRYWGFVPEGNIVGKAFFIWMNFGDLGRIGRFH